MSQQREGFSAHSDEELLGLLRGGDTDAYTELWRRHIDVALRAGRKIIPDRAEDLVSDSFLAVYQQVAIAGKGPESAFLPYLLATIRNTGIRWRKEAQLVDTDPDLDSIQVEDGLSALLGQNQSAEMLAAFEELPERWQRILWLTEIEEAKRPQIAKELGIKPNAVSALYRRARAGLQLQWLTQQVPLELRMSSEHVARQLPEFILTGRNRFPTTEVASHLRECAVCADLHRELASAATRMRRSTLGLLGFAALGVALPSASHLTAGVAGAGATAALLTLSGTAVAAGLGVVIAIGALAPTNLTRSPSPTPKPTSSHSQNATGPETGKQGDTPSDGLPPETPERDDQTPQVGRGVIDPSIPALTADSTAEPNDFWQPPTPPPPLLSDATPDPAPEQPGTWTPELRSGITTPQSGSGTLVPVLTGTTTPGAAVTIELRPAAQAASPFSLPLRYAADVTEDGSWTFDPAPILADKVGEFEFEVWAYTDDEVSPSDIVHFTLESPLVNGVALIPGDEQYPVAELSDTGIVYRITGEPDGTVCLTSVYPGQAFEIPLDEHGEATVRVRFLTGGWYYLTFRACEGDRRGAPAEVFVDVFDPDAPIFGPWGPDPVDTVIEVSQL